MIVSASVRSDIPAFYGEWFLNRVRAGYCRYVNPYNPRLQPTIYLNRDEVDGFVFWTKNLGPFTPVLAEVHGRGYPFMIQYTINAYPRQLESRVVDWESSVRTLREAALAYGPLTAVWRYDTVVFSDITPMRFHMDNFRRIAARLEGATDEVVTSFVQMYKKTRANIAAAEREGGFRYVDAPDAQKRELLRFMVGVGRQHGMRVTLCAQPDLLVEGVGIAHCADRDRLARIAGRSIKASIKGTRPLCECYAMRDIGAYDTCPHGCIYCYAVQDRAQALERYRQHDPRGEFLFTPEVVVPARQERLL